MTPESVSVGLNTAWTLIAAFLVFFMQAGFGMLEAGLIRSKNTVNILLKNFLDFCIASVAFYLVGYAFMFGQGNGFIGGKGFSMFGLDATAGGLPLLAFWLFQVVFCGTAATIVAGAMAERTKFQAYLIYSLLMSALIYPIIGHWAWGGGWLAEKGFLDFAGSTVVHTVGGMAALAGAIMLGPRLGRFTEKKSLFKSHNFPLAALGTLILWFGWFGFNPGSTLGLSDPGLVAKIAVNTNLAAATGAIAALFISWWLTKKPDAGMVMNGILAGLVGITAGCAYVTPLAAMVIGILSAIVMMIGVAVLEKIRVDDPVGAVPVHAFAGIFGTLAVGLFHTEQGLFYTGSWASLGIQALGTFSAAAFVFISMLIMFAIIKVTVGIRVPEKVEHIGLDLGEHELPCYPEFAFVSEFPETREHRGSVIPQKPRTTPLFEEMKV